MHVKHVWCDDGSGAGVQLGHIVRSAYENEQGETKSDVYVQGHVIPMGYREPSDPNNTTPEVTGSTFWNIVDEEGSNK